MRASGPPPPPRREANQAQPPPAGDFALGTQRAHRSLAEDVALAAGRYDLVVIASTAIRGHAGARRAGGRGELMAPPWQALVRDRLILDRPEGGAPGGRSAHWESAGGGRRDAFEVCEGGIRLSAGCP